MSQYKLTYFNLTALGEPIRWVFKYAKVNFEDERINMEDWPGPKGRFPLGQMPLLLEDGKEMTQSAAILRYLGAKFGLTTGDPILDYRVDQVTEIVTDGRLHWRKFLMEKDEEAKAEIKKNLLANEFPKVLKQLNDIVSEQGGPFIAGSNVSYGDFALAHWLQIWTKTLCPNLLEKYPALAKQLEAVVALPAIAKWIQERPVTFV